MQIDDEERREKERKLRTIDAQVRKLKETRKGEPTRFHQAGKEIYAWWRLSNEIKGSQVKVDVTRGGAHMKVMIQNHVIFDQDVFAPIRADDVLWSIEDADHMMEPGRYLHLTLTKREESKLWECLAFVPEVQRDEKGDAIPSTIPEPYSVGDRLEAFRQMVHEDDGEEVRYEDLSYEAREYVDLMKRYEHARATGDKRTELECYQELSDQRVVI